MGHSDGKGAALCSGKFTAPGGTSTRGQPNAKISMLPAFIKLISCRIAPLSNVEPTSAIVRQAEQLPALPRHVQCALPAPRPRSHNRFASKASYKNRSILCCAFRWIVPVDTRGGLAQAPAESLNSAPSASILTMSGRSRASSNTNESNVLSATFNF